jgi:hypothetical protein
MLLQRILLLHLSDAAQLIIRADLREKPRRSAHFYVGK